MGKDDGRMSDEGLLGVMVDGDGLPRSVLAMSVLLGVSATAVSFRIRKLQIDGKVKPVVRPGCKRARYVPSSWTCPDVWPVGKRRKKFLLTDVEQEIFETANRMAREAAAIGRLPVADREIAKECHVSLTTVGLVRKKVLGVKEWSRS